MYRLERRNGRKAQEVGDIDQIVRQSDIDAARAPVRLVDLQVEPLDHEIDRGALGITPSVLFMQFQDVISARLAIARGAS